MGWDTGFNVIRHAIEPTSERESALRGPDIAATSVTWSIGGRTIGCQLIYRLSVAAVLSLRAALEAVLGICDWKMKVHKNCRLIGT
jgi:hypothetical protein